MAWDMMNTALRLAAIGLGPRSAGYLRLAQGLPDRYQIIAGADPKESARSHMMESLVDTDFRVFDNDEALLAQPKLADVMVIGTQDAQHRDHAIAAMEKGYDLLLEKPIATTLADVLAVNEAATRLGRRVLVCHVMRYTALYSTIKKLVDQGRIGEIISLNAVEGVGAFHQAHSYVRGHWRRVEDSSPMIIAKSCHDLDLIHWMIDSPAVAVSSFGGLEVFTPKHAPEGAPLYCRDGCPLNGKCAYDAHLYAEPAFHEKWMYINPALHKRGTPRQQILDWVLNSPWGRCVYHCDNTAVDHQVANFEFQNGVTATFTMTAFARGRTMEIFGTEGVIRAGAFFKQATGSEILVQNLDASEVEHIKVESKTGGYDSHGGGDEGLIDALYEEMNKPSPAEMTASIQTSVMSHIMGFAAEEARLTGRVVQIEDFLTNHTSPAGSTS